MNKHNKRRTDAEFALDITPSLEFIPHSTPHNRHETVKPDKIEEIERKSE